MTQVITRITSFFQDIKNQDAIVVSHADPLVALQAVIKQQGEK